MAGLTSQPLGTLRQLLRPGIAISGEVLPSVPATAGAYVLAIRLDRPVLFARSAKRRVFAPGWYLYCGSAHGPGGLAARLRRHFRRDKTPHWHVDELTSAASHIDAVAVAGGSECDLVARLEADERFESALAGFGSSDCRRCRTHLLVWRGSGEGMSIGHAA